jgi:hypothetical protein
LEFWRPGKHQSDQVQRSTLTRCRSGSFSSPSTFSAIATTVDQSSQWSSILGSLQRVYSGALGTLRPSSMSTVSTARILYCTALLMSSRQLEARNYRRCQTRRSHRGGDREPGILRLFAMCSAMGSTGKIIRSAIT